MRSAFLFLFTLIAAVAYGQQSDVPYVVLVSFDGFRYDYVSKYNAPNFKALIKKGVRSQGLIPSFPSKTFPNHYSIVTGLYPGHHGLVDNGFYDPQRDVFYAMNAKDRVTDPYFYGGKPIWELAKENGIRTASYFWVGSELPANHPDYYYPYDQKIIDTTRIGEVLRWLSLPKRERPHFISLYFSSPDHEGHAYGPDAEETKQAVLHADELLGKLMDGIAKSQLPVNLLVVSDHGMKGLKQEASTYIVLDEVMNVNAPGLKISNGGTQAHLYLKSQAATDSLYLLLKSQENNFRVMKQSQFPDQWNYKNQRAGDLLVVANEGYYIRERDRAALANSIKSGGWFGVHGYDPTDVRDMWGIFYASGPNIQRGVKLQPFENVQIFPLMARILNLPIPKVDGSLDLTNKIYKRTR